MQVAYFCLLLFIFIFTFLMKLHPRPLLLLIYFASNSSIPGIDFFLEKEFTLLVCLIIFLRNHLILDQVSETIILWKNILRTHRGILLYFPVLLEMPCISHVVKYKIRWESEGTKVLIRWGKNGYQFPRKFDGFRCIFPCYRKLMGKPMYFTYYKAYYRM